MQIFNLQKNCIVKSFSSHNPGFVVCIAIESRDAVETRPEGEAR